ncbi:MAG: hypothetical protein AAFX94_03585, partial [Myxococcota bacterium]
ADPTEGKKVSGLIERLARVESAGEVSMASHWWSDEPRFQSTILGPSEIRDGELEAILPGNDTARGAARDPFLVTPNEELIVNYASIDEVLSWRLGTETQGSFADRNQAIRLASPSPGRNIALHPNGRLFTVGANGIAEVPTRGDSVFATAKESPLSLADSNGRRFRTSTTDLLAIDPGGSVVVGLTLERAIVRFRTEPGFSDYGLAYAADQNGRHINTLDRVTGRSISRYSYTSLGLDTVTDANGQTLRVERDTTGNVSALIAPGGQRTELAVVDGLLQAVSYADGSAYGFAYEEGALLSEVTKPDGGRFTHVFDQDGRLESASDPSGGTWTYDSTLTGGTTSTVATSAEGEAASYTTRLEDEGQVSHSTLLASGDEQRVEIANGGRTERRTVCGILTESQFDLGSDSSTRLTRQTITTPSGLQMEITLDETRELDEFGELSRLTESLTRNGRTRMTAVHDPVMRQSQITSAEGIVQTQTFSDSLLRESFQVSGLDPLYFDHDPRGRLTEVQAGSRIAAFVYGADGSAESKTNFRGGWLRSSDRGHHWRSS